MGFTKTLRPEDILVKWDVFTNFGACRGPVIPPGIDNSLKGHTQQLEEHDT